MAKLKIYVIGSEEIVILLGLLGIEGTVLKSNKEFMRLFEKIASNTSIGMIIIAYNLNEENFQQITDFKLNKRKPFIFYMPDMFSDEEIYFKKIFKTIRKITA